MDTYLLCLEQLYPLCRALEKELERFKHADIVWCQEEPKNMGAWFFVNPLIEQVMLDLRMKQTRPGYGPRLCCSAGDWIV